MKKQSDNTLAVGVYSLLTVLSSAVVSNGGEVYSSDAERLSSSKHSLILPVDTPRFTESLIIVGTLDGKLRALDPAQNGVIRWSTAVSEEPLLSSSLSSFQMMKEFTGFRLIPSLDGGLYQFSWDSIEAIPLTADTLLSSSFKLNEGIGLVGGKNVEAMGIDPRTGKIIYTCSNDGCNESEASDSLNDILVIKRTQKTVRAVSERTGAERWNFSVGQHKLNFLNGDQSGPHERIPVEHSDAKQNIQVSIPEGKILGVKHQPADRDEHLPDVVWQKTFDTPVAAVWLLENGSLEKLDLLKITAPPKSIDGNQNLPLMYYIGSHNDQLYVHLSDDMQDKKHALSDQSKRRFVWKPYLATSASRTPAIVGKTELAIRQPLEYPFGDGHYFYGQVPNPMLNEEECLNNSTNADGTEKENQRGILYKLKKFVSKWWRELLILLFTVGFFARQIFKYWRKRVACIKTDINLKLTVGDCTIQVSRDGSEGQSPQTSSPTTASLQENFVSRYQCDFEHETCLGKGAFGVVFQARNKLDDCQYAVKRIRLPNNHKAKRKVMREVKVLATLDHPGIVRYYNSWCEEPPIEWLRDWDEKLKGDSLCSTFTSIPSLTEQSDEDKGLYEISANSGSMDEENMIQNSRSKSSRKRLDTLTVENEGSYENMEGTTSGADSSASFGVEFHPHSLSRKPSNNNARKVDEESSGVVFEGSNNSNTEDEDSDTHSSIGRNESGSPHSSEKEKAPLHLLYIQMQLCCRDSLKDWLNTHIESRNYSVSINIFKQLVVAVDYIHQKGHIHRDLKPSNILFAPDGAVKVGDFGLVAACEPSVKEESDCDESKESSNQNLTGQVGTQLYMSPEQVKSQKYCSRVDIYSLGIIFFELFHVFKTQMERHNVLTAVRKRSLPETFKKEMPSQSELVLWLLAENPQDRPSAQEISSSTVFTELLDKLSPPPSSPTSP